MRERVTYEPLLPEVEKRHRDGTKVSTTGLGSQISTAQTQSTPKKKIVPKYTETF